MQSAINKKDIKLIKTPTGIEGLDEITGGGFPEGRPSLIKKLPLPKKTLIGTFSDKDKVIKALGITIQ